MIKKHQQYSDSFKAKVALEAIREDNTLSQLSSKYQINANVISKWKKQALENLDSLFSGKHDSVQVLDEQKLKDLHAKIGELTLERDFLSQASSRLGLGIVKKW